MQFFPVYPTWWWTIPINFQCIFDRIILTNYWSVTNSLFHDFPLGYCLLAGATAHAMGGGCPFSASGSLSGHHGHHGHGSELPSISRFFHQPKHLTISWAVNGCKFLTVPRWIFVAQPIRPPLPYATGSFLPGNPSSAAAGLQWWRIEKAISEGLFKGADLARPPLYICFHEIYVYILRVLHMNRQFKVHCCIKL